MSGLRSVALAMIAAASPIAILTGSGIARSDAPAPGDACTALYATTHDVNGRTNVVQPDHDRRPHVGVAVRRHVVRRVRVCAHSGKSAKSPPRTHSQSH